MRIASWLRNVLYLAAAIVLAVPLLVRYLRTGKSIAAFREKLTGLVPAWPGGREETKPIWIHAVSVGEVLQVAPLVEALRRRDPSVPIVISSTTATGLTLARERFSGGSVGHCRIIAFPFDFSWAVANCLRRVNPRAIVLIELELWPNLLAEAARWGIPVSIVSGRLSETSHRGYRRVSPLIRPMLRSVASIATQTDAYRDRFIDLGARPATTRTTGCLKHDSLSCPPAREATIAMRVTLGISPAEVVVVAGSTHDPEERLVLDAYLGLLADGVAVRLILVPRHPERFEAVADAVESTGLPLVRRSQSPHRGSAPIGPNAATPVVLLDTVGELSTCWHLADVAFVGGSLTQRGGQNMLEPAAAGAAVLFGPHVWNFARESRGLLDRGGATCVADGDSLREELRQLATQPQRRAAMATAADRFVATLTGCADDAAAELLPAEDEQRRAA